MFRVLLVQPPNSQRSFTRSGTLLPPLGLASVAAYLRLHDVCVKIVDAEGQRLGSLEIEREIHSYRADIVGITCTSFTVTPAIEVAKITKKVSSATTVIGGPHVSLNPHGLLKDFSEVDITVQNEGEITMLELTQCLEKGLDLRNVDGVSFRSRQGLTTNKPRTMLNLDDLPQPAWDLLPRSVWKNYWDPRARRFPIATLQTNRGCPHQCIYCSEPKIYGRGVRFRTASNVVDEIQRDQEMLGIRELSVVDSVFTLWPKRVIEICDEIISRRLDISWACNSRVDTIRPDLLSKMKKAGCHRIYFGVETGSQDELPLIRKRITLDQVRRAVAICKKNMVHVETGFIIGFPRESMNQVKETIEFARSLSADSTQFSILLPLPGTEVYQMAAEMGIELPPYWNAGFNSPKVTLSALSVRELIRAQNWAYRRTYFKPRYLVEQLARIRSLNDLKYNISRIDRFLRYIRSMSARIKSAPMDDEVARAKPCYNMPMRLAPMKRTQVSKHS